MNTTSKTEALSAAVTEALPRHPALYYGGAWHEPISGRFEETLNPSTGQPLARVAVGNAADVDAAVAAAARGFAEWRAILPLERGRILRRMAEVLRKKKHVAAES